MIIAGSHVLSFTACVIIKSNEFICSCLVTRSGLGMPLVSNASNGTINISHLLLGSHFIEQLPLNNMGRTTRAFWMHFLRECNNVWQLATCLRKSPGARSLACSIALDWPPIAMLTLPPSVPTTGQHSFKYVLHTNASFHTYTKSLRKAGIVLQSLKW